MRNKTSAIKIFVGVGAIALLLLPPMLSALVWTPINIYFAVAGTALTVFTAIKFPRLRWLFAILTGAVIALPPYPNWIYWSEGKGWHSWLGPSLRSFEIGANLLLMCITLLLFAALFWAIGSRQPELKR